MRVLTTHLMDTCHTVTHGGEQDRTLKGYVDTVAGPPPMGIDWPSDWDNGMQLPGALHFARQ